MRRRLLLFVAAIGMCTMLRAQSASMSLVVELRDGTSSVFLLSEKPEMGFENGEIVFKSTKAELSVALKDFESFYFKSIEEGVEVPASGAAAEFVAPGVLRLRGVNVAAVAVYALDGSACSAEKMVEGDAVIVSLRSLPQGVYVVRYGATAVKMSNN